MFLSLALAVIPNLRTLQLLQLPAMVNKEVMDNQVAVAVVMEVVVVEAEDVVVHPTDPKATGTVPIQGAPT